MRSLIVNAQVNLLPALAVNGFKLKLLMALYAGRHCLVNSIVGENTIIKRLCNVADNNAEIVNKISLLMKEPFTEKMIRERQKVLSDNFDIANNAGKLKDLVFNVSSDL
jgi:glycosyltransferase involved in cell wall biosynthesis